MIRRRLLPVIGVIAVVGAVLWGGCERRAPAPPPATGIEHSAESGPVRVSRTLSGDSISTVESVEMRVSIESSPGVVVVAPPIDGALGEFTVASVQHLPSSITSDGLVRGSTVYHLEPFLDGVYTVPEMTYRWLGPEGSGTVALPPADITVTSVLTQADVPATELRPLPQVEPAGRRSALAIVLLTVGAAGVACVVTVFAVLVVRRRREPDWVGVAALEMKQIESQLSSGGLEPGEACARAARAVERAGTLRERGRLLECGEAIDVLRFRGHDAGPEEARRVITLTRQAISDLSARPRVLDQSPHPGTEN